MSFHSLAFMGIAPFGNLLIGSMAEKIWCNYEFYNFRFPINNWWLIIPEKNIQFKERDLKFYYLAYPFSYKFYSK